MTTLNGVLTSSFHGTWAKSMNSEDYARLTKSTPCKFTFHRRIRFQPMMKNVNEGKGLFAPIMVVTRNIVGKKRFNQLRGKAIALHSQMRNKDRGLIQLAKKNGEKLGFLA